GPRADMVAEPLLERLELVLDAAFGLEAGELFADGWLAAEIVGLDLALDLVERALDLLESSKRIGDALVIKLGAHFETRGGRLLARDHRPLARLGVGELRLQLGDVLVLAGERLFDVLELLLERFLRRGNTRLGHERALGEVLAALGDGELGAALPFLVLGLERIDAARELALFRDRAHGRRAHLDQRVLHLLDDHPDDLLRILGAVEDGVDVGIHDVGETRKDAHDNPLCGGRTMPRAALARGVPALRHAGKSLKDLHCLAHAGGPKAYRRRKIRRSMVIFTIIWR